MTTSLPALAAPVFARCGFHDDRNLTFSMMNIHLLPSTPTLYDDAPELRQLISSPSIYYLGGLPHYTATRG